MKSHMGNYVLRLAYLFKDTENMAPAEGKHGCCAKITSSAE